MIVHGAEAVLRISTMPSPDTEVPSDIPIRQQWFATVAQDRLCRHRGRACG